MHFEILVEDQSGKKALDLMVPKIVGEGHTCKVHSYKGVGRIPKDLRGTTDPNKRILLDRLPRLLRGYGNKFSSYPSDYSAVVIVVCDLDDKCLKEFRRELYAILNACHPLPKAHFCIAIEEGEAWFLGDLSAIKTAYPQAKETVLNGYVNDAVCGTWEKLADAIYPGGADRLKAQGWQSIGAEKTKWADNITPHLNMDENKSPSFIYFRDKLRELASQAALM
ncbi:MAG: hypothetical protein HQL64_09055 [Magnetococcales bacterium]|nr:hypothetical protein [Magnetococcales bacterium]